MLREVPIAANSVHPMPVNGTLRDCAQRYEDLLKTFQAHDESTPLFDVVLLGMGADGHTASLLPNSPILEERGVRVAAVDHGRTQPRITLTLPAIANSRIVAFLVAGAEKQSAVLAALGRDQALPAARFARKARWCWFSIAPRPGRSITRSPRCAAAGESSASTSAVRTLRPR